MRRVIGFTHPPRCEARKSGAQFQRHRELRHIGTTASPTSNQLAFLVGLEIKALIRCVSRHIICLGDGIISQRTYVALGILVGKGNVGSVTWCSSSPRSPESAVRRPRLGRRGSCAQELWNICAIIAISRKSVVVLPVHCELSKRV